jgi:outer membrane protein OmpA-like peptidoglycan-associated protein
MMHMATGFTFKGMLFSLFILSISISAQEEHTRDLCNEMTNKKAFQLFMKGTDKKKYEKPERIKFLMEAIEIEPEFADAQFTIAHEVMVRCMLEEKPYVPARPFYMAAIKYCPQISSEAYYYIAHSYYDEFQNDSAIRYFNLFLNFKDEDAGKFPRDYEQWRTNAKLMRKECIQDKQLKYKVPFDPKVVTGVSTERDEYLSYITPDDKYCMYVRMMPRKDLKVYSSDKETEKFMLSKRDPKTGQFDKGDLMYYPFNETDDNQGGCSISIDNKHLYFAMMKNEGGMQPNVDLYVCHGQTDKFNDEWSGISKLPPPVNDPKYWDSQPSIAADGVTLYFASDRPGGYGGIDIYVTKFNQTTKQWSVPENLGPNINTPKNEKTPFIHSDSETLYFSSNGLFGFGGYDIYYVRKDINGKWDLPVNIGSPINAEGEDACFFVSKDAQTAYFSSFDEGRIKGKGMGRYDLFSFPLYKDARPQNVDFYHGKAVDPTGQPIVGAVVEQYNLETKEKKNLVVDSITGNFMGVVSKDKFENFVLTVKKPVKEGKDSILFNTTLVDAKKLASSPTTSSTPITITVTKAEQGKNFIIDNLHYKTNSAEITSESKAVLDAFAVYLLDHESMHVEIQGYTDNVGNPKDNEALSRDRAYSVKQYLEEQKVPGKRVSAQGFGPNKPIADNKTEVGRAQNRRTEFVILED